MSRNDPNNKPLRDTLSQLSALQGQQGHGCSNGNVHNVGHKVWLPSVHGIPQHWNQAEVSFNAEVQTLWEQTLEQGKENEPQFVKAVKASIATFYAKNIRPSIENDGQLRRTTYVIFLPICLLLV